VVFLGGWQEAGPVVDEGRCVDGGGAGHF
jgi:hypothetical protein